MRTGITCLSLDMRRNCPADKTRALLSFLANIHIHLIYLHSTVLFESTFPSMFKRWYLKEFSLEFCCSNQQNLFYICMQTAYISTVLSIFTYILQLLRHRIHLSNNCFVALKLRFVMNWLFTCKLYRGV